MVTIFTTWDNLKKVSLFYKHSAFVYFVPVLNKQRLSSYTTLTGFYNRDSVYCAIQTESLNRLEINFSWLVDFRIGRVNNVQVSRVKPLSNVFVTLYFVFLQCADL